MRILLVTPEFDPLTGSSRSGLTARNIAEELQACSEIDFAIALPATQSLLDQLAEGVLTTAAETVVPGARVHSIELDEGPTLYLLAHDELRAGFPLADREEDLANRMILWSALLLDLVKRLRPPIHLVHLIGWESALLPALLRYRSFPVATVFTNPAGHGHGPSLSKILEIARLGGIGDLLTGLGGESPGGHAADRALADADAADALNDFAHSVESPPEGNEPAGPRPLPAHHQLSRSRLAGIYGLEDNPGTPLLFIPTRDPEVLLPILPRLLDSGAHILLETPRQPAVIEAVLIDLAHRRPRCFARVDPAQSPTCGELDSLDGADFLLLLPVDASDPLHLNTAARAADRHCTPILPGASALPGGTAFTYRSENAEAIWSAIKAALALRRSPERWRDHLERLPAARTATGGLSPRLASLYRNAVRPALSFS